MAEVIELRATAGGVVEATRLRDVLAAKGGIRKLIEWLQGLAGENGGALKAIEAILDLILGTPGAQGASALTATDTLWLDSRIKEVCGAPAAEFTGAGTMATDNRPLVSPAAVGDFLRIVKKVLAVLALFGITIPIPIPGFGASSQPVTGEGVATSDSVACETVPAGGGEPGEAADPAGG